MIRLIYLLGVLALSVGIAACSGLLDSNEPAERVYWLEPLIVQQSVVADAVLPSLGVSVTARPGLDTDRLLILGPGAQLNHYAMARWPDNIPEVLESLLKTTLQSSARYTRVTAGPSSVSMDWKLELEVRELFTQASTPDNARTVRMVLSGYVSCPESDHVIAMQASVEIGNNRLSHIVAAYQQALNEVSLQLVTQLAKACGVTNPSNT